MKKLFEKYQLAVQERAFKKVFSEKRKIKDYWDNSKWFIEAVTMILGITYIISKFVTCFNL